MTAGAGALQRRERWTRGEVALLAAIGFFLALRVIVAAFAFPLSDEAYYWVWGRNLQLSYYDHPPLGAWVQGMSHALFGTNLFALRLPTFIGLTAVLSVLYLVARRIGGDEWRPLFLRSTLVFLASPLFGVLGAVAMHDYLLVALLLGAGYLFTVYFAQVEVGGRARLWRLLVAAALLGLAGLTKYIAICLGVAVILAVLTRPKLRPLLLGWQIYAAGLIAVALQAPVLIWNLGHDFVSLAYQLVGRHGGAHFTGINVVGMTRFIAEALALVSPVLLVPIALRFFVARGGGTFESVGRTLALWMFLPAALVFLFVSNYGYVLFWWATILFVLVVPFSGRYVGAIALAVHVLWGGLISIFFAVSLAITPIAGRGGPLSIETDHMYGWERVAAAVREALQAHSATLVAANRYQSAGQLAFALDDANVVALSDRRDAFDFWFDPAAHVGEDAIVLVVRRDDTQSWKRQFASVEKLEEVQLGRFGTPLATYEIWLGRDFTPAGE